MTHARYPLWTPWQRAAVLFAVVAACAYAGDARAQSLTFNSKNSDDPIIVTAQQNLEFQQDEKRFIAHGNAKAVQGDANVVADELTAYYRDKAVTKPAPAAKDPAPPAAGDNATGNAGDDKVNSSEIYRVDAIGHVTITSKTDVTTGNAAVYDFDKAVLVVQGDPVVLTTSDGTVTAHHTLQYWSDQKVAVATGDALAVEADKTLGRRLKADQLTAYFRPDDDAAPSKPKDHNHPTFTTGKNDITFIVGEGNAVLTTKTEVITGDHANYNVDTGIATVDGHVKMTRDKTQLDGGFAVVNVKTDRSNLYGSRAQSNMPGGLKPPARVQGLLAPTPKSAEDTSHPSTPAPSKDK